MSTTTAILSLVKNADGDNARTALSTNESANMDAIDALFHATTGHDHTGTGTKGTLIPAAALAAEAWATFTPTVVQGAAVTVGINSVRYKILGKTVFVLIDIALQSAGTAANAIQITGIPAALAPKHLSENAAVIGSFRYFDAGAVFRTGVVTAYLADSFVLNVDGEAGHLGVAGPTVASGDGIGMQLCYEIA